MKVAALDLGSNSFLCLMGNMNSSGKFHVVEDLMEVVRLGQGVEKHGVLAEEALARADACLSRFSSAIKSFGAERVCAVATAAARTAKNSSDFVDICVRNKIPVSILSGDQEAELTFKGFFDSDQMKSEMLVVDIGGGSTEVVLGDANSIIYRKSFDIGSVNLKERWISAYPIAIEEKNCLLRDIKKHLQPLSELRLSESTKVVAVAGTPTTLAAATLGEFNRDKIEGYEFTQEHLVEWSKKLEVCTPNEIEKLYGIPTGRADVVGIGLYILIEVLNGLRRPNLRVSTKGVRYGLAKALALGVVF